MRRRAMAMGGALAMLLAAAQGRAETAVGLGAAKAIDGEPAHLLTLAWRSERRHPWEAMLGYIAQREYAGRVRLSDALVLAASKRFTWRGWFASGGIAWVSEDNEVLSGHGQFLTAAGWQGRQWGVSLRHLSNGDTGGRNRGETFLLLERTF